MAVGGVAMPSPLLKALANDSFDGDEFSARYLVIYGPSCLSNGLLASS